MKPIKNFQDYQKLLKLLESLSFDKIKSDQRIQVKMPSLLVKLLDQEFPKITRSQLLTQAVLELLIRKKRIQNPELEAWVSQEQYDLIK